MTQYFDTIPKINYRFPDGNVLNVTSVFIRPQVVLSEQLNSSANEYTIDDGKSPDNIAFDLYEDPHLFFTVLLTNDIVDFYKEWPTSYSAWENELKNVNDKVTFYTRYKLNIEVGDLVCKYQQFSDRLFDDKNYGIITDFDSFYRSFDVKMISGNISVGENYIILRKRGNSYFVIEPTEGVKYQKLVKKINKLESVYLFEKKDDLTGFYGSISPYYMSDGSVMDDSVNDIGLYPDSILWKYMNSQIPTGYRIISYKNNKESEWFSRKNIVVIPKTRIFEFLSAFSQSINEQRMI